MNLVGLFFPPQCLCCPRLLERDGPSTFCDDCDLELEPLPAPGCPRCAEPMLRPQLECPRCRLRPPPFQRAFAPFCHEGAIARAVHLFKYEDRPELARPLGRLLAHAASAFLAKAPPTVCPIPLHPARARRRRYDQALLLARALAQVTGRGCLPGGLERVRATRRQVGLPEEEREKNVLGAFQASPGVQGKAVLLVDDVFTTGATARAASAALLAAGAVEVQVLTLARAYTAAQWPTSSG